MTRRVLICTAAVLAFAGTSIVAQDVELLKARELFYGQNPSKKPAAAPASNRAKTPPPNNTVTPPPEPEPRPRPPSIGYTTLGLRYSILKRTAADVFVETDVNTTFRSGDGIRLGIESNGDAYLYIVTKGSSGTWSLLFPSPDINDGINRVQAHQPIEVPARGQFTFVDQPGEERVFIVLSRVPEADLEQLIYSINQVNRPKEIAARSISDDLVARLRESVRARDLIFEKEASEPSVGAKQAMYVVNLNAGGPDRIAADVSLRHR